MIIDDSFFAVVNKRGEVETVESTLEGATNSACLLSPYTAGKPPATPIGREVIPVTVLVGDFDQFLYALLSEASELHEKKLHAHYADELEQATTTDPKSGKEIVIAGNSLINARKKLLTGLSLRSAF